MKTSHEWEAELGRQIRALRLRLNIDQRDLAKRAGIALSAVKNLESGNGVNLRSLIQTLRVLNRVDWLGALAPPVSISPVQMLKARTPRQRASRNRTPRQRASRNRTPRQPASRKAKNAKPS